MQIQGGGVTANKVHNSDNDSCDGCVFYKKQLFKPSYCALNDSTAIGVAARSADALAGTNCKSHNYIWARVV